MSLAIISTHPIQYHAPVYRTVQEKFNIPVTVIYGSDFSVSGYEDPGFSVKFAWDTDLLSGYSSVFLSRVANGGARTPERTSPRGLLRALDAVKPKVVMLLGYTPRFNQFALGYSLLARDPLLYRAEATDHARNRGLLKQLLRDTILSRLYGRMSALLYVGKRACDHYRRLGVPEKRLFYSPYCVDTEPFKTSEEDRQHLRQPSRHELGLNDTDIVVLFSGKLISVKGVDVLLQAVQESESQLRERIVILFVGDGILRQSLEMQSRCDPPVRTRFVGFKNQRALSAYYHAADLLALPSHSETWGLVVNEALHHGLPCIVSNQVGCAPDLVEQGKTGEVFQAESASDLSAALERATLLAGRADVREVCRARVANYTVEKAAEGIAAAYQAVIGR